MEMVGQVCMEINRQASINYAAFFGGKRVFDQPYRDRNFVGFTLSRNF